MTKKAEEDHIKSNQKAFDAALAKATMSVRSNAAFVGLNKIREPLAFQAALKATGYNVTNFNVPKTAGPPNADVQARVNDAFLEAVNAAISHPKGTET